MRARGRRPLAFSSRNEASRALRGLWPWARLGLALIALFIGFGPARPAFAHASLLSALPADGVTIYQPAKTFRLEFNEPVSPLVFRLIAPDGRITALTDVEAANRFVTIAAPVMPQQGTYVLSWRVISADGHPVGGVVSFSLGHPSSGVSAPPAAGAAVLHVAIWAAEVVLFIGLFIGLGGAAFAAWLAAAWPMHGRTIFAATLLGGAAAAVLSLPLQGLDALAQPLGDILQPAVWIQGIVTSWGLTAFIALAVFAAGLAALATRSRLLSRLLTGAAVAAIGVAFTVSGHAGTTEPRLVTVPAVFIHAVCITVWIGALLPLILAVRSGDPVALERFSRLIPVPLLMLVATGVVLACIELDRPDALWTTDYGLVLSAKLALVVALLALAAVNRYALLPRLAMKGAHRLLIVIATELSLALVILGVVGLWRFTPPPRALAAAETTYIHFHADPAMAQIDLTPERDRGAFVTIDVTDSDLNPIAAKEVTLVIWNPGAGIEPIRRDATFESGARWSIRQLRIPIAGVWRMRVEILISDFDKVMIEDNVELPRAS